ncbi:MAG: hypothetical protein ACOCYG_09800, partial [Spirochaetota bacterium]
AGTPAASEPADAGSAAAAAPTGAAAPRALDDAAIATVSTILEERKPTLAATLKKADRWQEEPAGTLWISFADRFAANTVRQELALVAEAAEQALGRGVSIKVTDHATESAGGEGEDVSETRDETVEMVREVFRGRIVEE